MRPEGTEIRDLFSLFPACAGVIPKWNEFCASKTTVPRMCGGDPVEPLSNQDICTCSPHVRG